jgi:hypothetical protein
MAITSTPPLPIASATQTGTSPSGGSLQLALVLQQPYLAPLFLRTITVNRSTVNQSIIRPGTDGAHGGSALIQQVSATYDETCAHAANAATVVVRYDNATMKVIGLDFSPSLAAVS